MILLKESKARAHRRIDFAGAAFFSGAVLFLMLGLNLVGEGLAFQTLLLASVFLAASLCLVLLFFRQEKRQAQPILDMVLLKSKPFIAANVVNMVMGAGFFGLFSFVPLYAVSVHKLSTLASGMILTPRSIGVIAASVITSFLLKRWGYRWPLILGLVVVALGTIPLAPIFPLWGARGDWIRRSRDTSLLSSGLWNRGRNRQSCCQQRLYRADAREGGHHRGASRHVQDRGWRVGHLADYLYSSSEFLSSQRLHDNVHPFRHCTLIRYPSRLPHAFRETGLG